MKNKFESKWKKVTSPNSNPYIESYQIDFEDDIILSKDIYLSCNEVCVSLSNNNGRLLYDRIIPLVEYDLGISKFLSDCIDYCKNDIEVFSKAKEKIESIAPKTVKIFIYKNLKFRRSEVITTSWYCTYKNFKIELCKAFNSNDWFCDIILNQAVLVEVRSSGKKKALDLALSKLKQIGFDISQLPPT